MLLADHGIITKVKITKLQLRRIIREANALNEEDEAAMEKVANKEGAAKVDGEEAAASKAELKQLLLDLSKKTAELKLSTKEITIISQTLKGLIAAADARDIAGKAKPFLVALKKLVG